MSADKPSLPLGQSDSRLRTLARGVWDGLSLAFRTIVRCLEKVLPVEFAWALIGLFVWLGFVSLIVWVVGG